MEINEQDTLAWRDLLNDNLTKENGWLALAGLFWLQGGENDVGAAVSNQIILPPDSAPEQVGTFTVQDGDVHLTVTAVNQVKINGEISNQAMLQADMSGTPTYITIGNLTMVLLQREALFAIRLWDNGRPERQHFNGRKWYPLQEKYHLQATYTPSATAETITLQRTIGNDFDSAIQGHVTFLLDGVAYKLLAFKQATGALFLPFKDKTTGKTTYGAGRYLLIEEIVDNKVTIDFNRAYSPPCAFTHFATCTLPPSENKLNVAIEVGELYPPK